ncbi:MAG: CDP-alcohol phosphatidyltransferase family protein [Rhodospirillales bacterium]|nr:CDP-alcohol phosphatidyltransferase family protein [Rhodospirillales bacterium]
MNIPNLISLGRLLASPVMVWLILDARLMEAFALFIAAGVSDAIDGFIAKRFNAETPFGKFLDPLADKALLVCVYISLAQADLLVVWLAIMVVFRDAVIVGGAILFHTLSHSLTMRPLRVSKVNTAAQIVLATAVLGSSGFDIEAAFLIDILVYAVAATTLVSGAMYVVTWGRMTSLLENGK